ncbi:hypothetical protein BKH30_08405 [Actinomyces oris]|uniref:Uncharacterized protein n=1 Tax=Actinomyces oris TaxID=544580 RepID=A0A1Q8VTU9_9ACTO|nr:hypothetical protein BKH30_08405 [Actinomyces oris]
MTASTEADSDTTPGADLDSEVAADQTPTDDAGADAGVGTGSLAFTSFLLALLCFSPFYMLGSNLWGLIDGRGLLLEFTDSDPALDRHLSFGHATVEMLGGYSVSHGILHGMSGGARFLVGLIIAIHLLLIAACTVAFVRFIAAIRPNRTGFVDQLFTRGGHLFWLLLGQGLSTLTLHISGLAISDEYFLGARTDTELTGFIPTGNDLPALKGLVVLILATHLLLALHRVYQRAGRLAAENTVLREETEGLV